MHGGWYHQACARVWQRSVLKSMTALQIHQMVLAVNAEPTFMLKLHFEPDFADSLSKPVYLGYQ